MPTYRVNYGYKGHKNALRSGALIMTCKDLADCRDHATRQLSQDYDWHMINSIKEVDSTRDLFAQEKAASGKK